MAKQLTFIGNIDDIIKPKGGTTRRSPKREKSEPVVYDCNTCGLSKTCKKAKIRRFGNGSKSILLVTLCPGRTEDKFGIPLIGESGSFTKEMFSINGFNLDDDCERTNVVRCYPGKDNRGRDKSPTPTQIKCCDQYLRRDIHEVKPKLIICLGTHAITSILGSTGIRSTNATTLHGKVIPSIELGCWVGCLFNPSFFIHREKSKEPIHDKLIFAYDLANILGTIGKPLPCIPTDDGNIMVKDVVEAIDAIDSYCDIDRPTTFDFECTTLEPDTDGAKILSVSITDKYEMAHFIPVSAINDVTGKMFFNEQEQALVLNALKKFIKSNTPKVVQNFYMEELWCRKFLGCEINNFIHDTMVSSHVVGYSNKGCTSLGFQALELTGQEYKGEVDRGNLVEESLQKLCTYNCLDSRHQINAYNYQAKILSEDRRLNDFNSLFTRGLKVLANLKERGIRIDVKMMETLNKEYGDEGVTCVELIRQLDSVKTIENHLGKDFNPNSPPQLQNLIYGEFKVEKTRERQTPTGQGSTDGEILKGIAEGTENQELKTVLGLIRRIKKCAEVKKKITEYKRVIHSDGRIHSTFWLNTADSFRSSSTKPNSQNAYKHDPELRKFRRIFLPDLGEILIEGDFKSMEVRTITMASGAKELIRYAVESVDPHKYWAGKIFKKLIEDITADEKYSSKNGFVFPSIYGSMPQAIAKYFGGKFSVDYIKSIQDEFWAELPEVREWQIKTINDYYQNGYIEGMSGCRIRGPLTIFQLFNLPIQGPAFHIFLDAFARIDEFMVSNKFKSKAINEIHDAGVFSAHPSEVDDVIALSTEIMVSKRFDWMGDVPLAVDWEIGENWYDMEPYNKPQLIV